MSVPPKIDGILNEESWQQAEEAGNFFERSPNNGQPEGPDFRSTVKILYDNTGIYFGAKLYDKEPSKIAKELTERDNISNDDIFGVVLNGYNDNQQSLEFFVTAAGVQFDAKLNSKTGEDGSWNGVWVSDVKIVEDGWVVEMKIPFSELRFPNKNVQEWGLNMARMVKRTQTMYDWNFVDNKTMSYSLYDGILQGIEDIKTPVRLSFLPYFSTYANSYNGENTFNVNGGMDLKYGINDAFTLDMTLIPDFGQANFDKAVLNLSPFEQQLEESRPFFTEGTELFSLGNLFYSRRIGGSPSMSPTLNENEEIIESPTKVNLFNGFKISGRTSKGLGIGVFNAITEKAEAKIKDNTTGEFRYFQTEPWANYNILVLDQRFGTNNQVSFVNTNVLRSGSFRDSNVAAVVFDLTDKTNTLNLFGAAKGSYVKNEESSFGQEYYLGSWKIIGPHRFSASAFYRDKKFDIDDLGYTGGNNYANYYTGYSYRYLKPKGNLNSLNYNLNIDYRRRLEPQLFNYLKIHNQLSMNTKKFLNYGAGLLLYPVGNNDIYEPRTFGRHLHIPAMWNPWIFLNTDSRKKFTTGGYVEFYKFDEENRINYASNLDFRYRFSDKFSVFYDINLYLNKNEVGFAGKDQNNIYMGRRDRDTYVNSLSSQYIFNEKMALNLAFRHYFSDVTYHNFHTLNIDGGITPNADFKPNLNGSFNSWNIDLRYSWWFAPGSQLTFLYRNAVENYVNVSQLSMKDNFDRLFSEPLLNNFSVKLSYYIDYNNIKNRFGKL